MAKAKFDIPTQPPVAVARPLYAGVGVTDLVVEAVRGAVADVQKRPSPSSTTSRRPSSGLDDQPRGLRDQATRAVADRVDTLGKDAQARRKVVEQRVAALQVRRPEPPDPAPEAGRRAGRPVPSRPTTSCPPRRDAGRPRSAASRPRRRPRPSAQTTTAKAKTTQTQATKTAKKTAERVDRQEDARKSPAKCSAKATATSAKKTASKTAEAITDAASKVGDSAAQ